MKRSDSQLQRFRNRLRRLAAQVGRDEWVLVGTIRPRRIPARRGASGKLLGPYYQWTFKEQGKTVTVNLSAGQVRPFQRAIDRQHRIEATLLQMRRLSRQFLEATTRGVKKRKPQPQQPL